MKKKEKKGNKTYTIRTLTFGFRIKNKKYVVNHYVF